MARQDEQVCRANQATAQPEDVLQPWEISAREGVRDRISRYNQAGDASRLDELAQQFTTDGILEVVGIARCVGREEIVKFLADLRTNESSGDDAPERYVRHFLTGLDFEEVLPTRVRAASYFQVIKRHGLDHCGRYRDVFSLADGKWRISHRIVQVEMSFIQTGSSSET